MYRVVLFVAAALAVVTGERTPGRSPNADMIEKFMKTSGGSRYSTNVTEDALLDAPGLIAKYGYPVEVHHAVTTDGYILEMHRIPHGRDQNNQPGRGRPVAFIMHGLLSSSADFLVLGPGSALAYILADAGYDVWLGNARGNYYSRRNIALDPDDRSTSNFWRFSWEQIGYHDLPAMVDYVLATTGMPNLHYIGHSQGGTAFLVLNSLRPEYNEKFISFQGLAPASFFDNNEHAVFQFLAPYERLLDLAAFQFGFTELLPNSPLITAIGLNFCAEGTEFQPICAGAVINAFEFEGNFNETLIPIFLGHSPAGASIRQVGHYGQSIRRNAFARFDFGPVTNLIVYGSLSPPPFDMSRVTVPTYLHYGLADREVDWRDVHLLASRLGNTIGLYRAERESFNHIDFIWGGEVKAEIFDQMLELMRTAEQNIV